MPQLLADCRSREYGGGGIAVAYQDLEQASGRLMAIDPAGGTTGSDAQGNYVLGPHLEVIDGRLRWVFR